MKTFISAAVLAASALLLPSIAHATIGEIYSNESSFLTDTGATSYNFGSYPLGTTAVSNPLQIGPLTVSSDGSFNVYNYVNPALASTGSMLDTSQASGYALGFLLQAADDTIVSVLMNGQYTLNSFTITSASPVFWGIDSSVPISDIQFIGATNTVVLGLDSDATFTPAVAATPEPSSLALLGTGILGLGDVIRRRFRSV